MRTERDALRTLSDLHSVARPDERREIFRRAFTTLSASASEFRPAPLEGIDPTDLQKAVRVALATGLIDQLDWLSPETSTAGLYELASALPAGDEKRELGRRVLKQLQEGSAVTFVTVATLLATGSKRGLSGDGIRARVALSLDLPISAGIRTDALALALVSKTDLEEEWLTRPSMGSLASRRLAARLLERAARESIRRTAQGDESAVAVFQRPTVVAAWRRLLGDREPLVWRHVASARGILCAHDASLLSEINEQLDPRLSPTEWRRSAASLAASIAVRGHAGLTDCLSLLSGTLFAEDRGLPTAFVYGLPRALESEPAEAEVLLERAVAAGGVDTLEATAELVSEVRGLPMADRLRDKALARALELSSGSMVADDGRAGLLEAIARDLRGTSGERLAQEVIQFAQHTFVTEGAQLAYQLSTEVVPIFEDLMSMLEQADHTTKESRIAGFLALHELDRTLLETSTFSDLLTIAIRTHESRKDGAENPIAFRLGRIYERLMDWLLKEEGTSAQDLGVSEHPMLRMRRIRTMLHLADTEVALIDPKSPAMRDRRVKLARALMLRSRDDTSSSLRRVLHAAAARAFDALIREEQADISDVLLAVVTEYKTSGSLALLAEASMVPEMAELYNAYAGLLESNEKSLRQTHPRLFASAEALHEIIRRIPAASSPRVEAFRRSLMNFEHAIERLAQCRSVKEAMGEAGDNRSSLVREIGDDMTELSWLVIGAKRRLHLEAVTVPLVGQAVEALDVSAVQILKGEPKAFADALAKAVKIAQRELPPQIAELALTALARLLSLPHEAPPQSGLPPGRIRRDAGLPPWLPPSRMLGGFYVVGPLGAGAVGSVFVARRAEEKTNERATRFALKVPEFAGAVARTLSETEFLQLFREEAGALLAIPAHPNLAKLVTFDAGAQPKPILVMELVDGPSLERQLQVGEMTVERALNIADGIAQGLTAMHDAGVGHLDVKPSNVILNTVTRDGSERPVLVDFGLSGRKLRPGCATANYGAPEVWGMTQPGWQPTAMAVDVYAFGCVLYELLTGKELFLGNTELALITAHLQHDGEPPALKAWKSDARFAPIATLLSSCLRQNPHQRTSMAAVLPVVASLRSQLGSASWPLSSAA